MSVQSETHRLILQGKLGDSSPKCVNCRHWKQGARDAISIGRCLKVAEKNPEFDIPVFTQDLSVCSAWEPKSA